MSEKSREEYFRSLIERYPKGMSKKQYSQMLNEACLVTGLHRKSAIRAITRFRLKEQRISRPGRPRVYSEGAIFALKRLYRDSEYLCSGKLHSMIPTLIEQYNLKLPKEVLEELKSISTASIDRYLRKYRKLESLKKRTTTRPGSKIFKKMIPLKSLANIAAGPGVLEADTVAHCGESLRGEFCFSLTMTDEYSGWTKNKAMPNKCAVHVQPAIEESINELPFETYSVNFDNGSEFLNHVVYGYFQRMAMQKGIRFPMTRSRSYHKNDNARAEQKNWTHVRQLFGYDRIDDQRLVDLMNEIYKVHNLIHNFFIPQYKLQSKVRVGSKIKKKYDKPKTPYQRLLESNLSEDRKEKLRKHYATLSYPQLKRQKDELLDAFMKLKDKINLEKRVTASSS